MSQFRYLGDVLDFFRFFNENVGSEQPITTEFLEVAAMNSPTVLCKKFKKELPALQKAPFPGPLGKEILENVSEQAWKMWRDDMQIKVLNEYRLNMGDPKDYQVLINQMQLFLGLKDGSSLEVENETRGREN
jgi:Fe-S cluster biosynthesis and repair protein YggX